MPSAEKKESRVKAVDEPAPAGVPDKNRGPQQRQSALLEPAGPKAPELKTGNFVDPAWRGVKYITPEVFRRRVYAYFGHGHSKSAMHRRLHSGRIFAIRIGNRWYIPEPAWDEFLERCKNGEQF